MAAASSSIGTDWTGLANMMVPPNGLSSVASPFFYNSHGIVGGGDSTDSNLSVAHHAALSASAAALNGSNGCFNNNNNFMGIAGGCGGSPIEQKMPLSANNNSSNNNNNGNNGNNNNNISMSSDSMSAIKQQFDWSSDPTGGIYGPFGGAGTHPMMMNSANGVMGQFQDPSAYLNDAYPSTSLSNNAGAYGYYPQMAAAISASGNYYPQVDYLQNAAIVNGWKAHLSSATATNTKEHKASINHRNSVMNHHPLGPARKPPHRTGPGTNNVRVRTHDTYRTVYSDRQRVELEKEFHSSQFITAGRKAELAGQLDLTERQIKIWFQNRRAKHRKQNPKSRGHHRH